jgi:signal transduction histidine kinase
VYLFSIILFGNVVTPWNVGFQEIVPEEILSMIVVGVVLAILLISRLGILNRNRLCEQERIKLKTTIKELSAANLGYSTFTQFVQHQASAEERNRIARDIHDGVGYTLTNIMMLGEAALERIPDDRLLREQLDAICVQARSGLADTRRSLRLLKSAESRLPTGLSAIRQMLDIFQKATGVEVVLQQLSKGNLIEHSSVFLTVYRFIQESLTNAFRHGHATRVTVRTQTVEDWLLVSVMDNGEGSQNVEEGIGLEGMRERIEALGGELHYYSKSGFTVVARLPVYEGADAN